MNSCGSHRGSCEQAHCGGIEPVGDVVLAQDDE